MNKKTLKQKAIIAVIWGSIERFSMVGIQLIVTLFLARILIPEDFGLIGMIAVFIAVSQSFIDSGFGQALIQKENTTQIDFSTIFYFNFFISALFYSVLFFSAPFIADFYNQPKLINLTRVISIGIIINAIGIVPRTRLTKKLDFKTQTKIGLSSVLISGIAGVSGAFYGCGVWALVIQNVTQRFFSTVFLFKYSKWLPNLVFSKESFKELFGFGGKLLVSGLIYQFFENLYLIIIGKYFSVSSLGYYTQAKKLQELPAKTLTSIIQKVAFPVFSTIQNDDIRLRAAFSKGIKITGFFVFPSMILLAVIAEPLVIVLIKEKWLPAVPLIQILAIGGLFYPFQVLNLSVIKAKGRSDLFLKLEIIKNIFLLLIIIISINFGLLGLVIGRVLFSIISAIFDAYYPGKFFKYGIINQLGDLITVFLISLSMGVFLYSFRYFIIDNRLLLLCQIFFSPLIYLGLVSLFNIDTYKEIKNLNINND